MSYGIADYVQEIFRCKYRPALLCKLLLRTIERRTHKIHFSATFTCCRMSQRRTFQHLKNVSSLPQTLHPTLRVLQKAFLHYCNLHPCKIHPREFYFYMSSISRRKLIVLVLVFILGGEVSCQALCYSISYLLQFALQF